MDIETVTSEAPACTGGSGDSHTWRVWKIVERKETENDSLIIHARQCSYCMFVQYRIDKLICD